jgi:hypothetical protein
MEGDDPGVLGNLPRSRPGRRSDKRAGTNPAGSERSRATRARPAREDPLAGTLGAAGRLASAGVRTGTAVTRELLRRLPRP